MANKEMKSSHLPANWAQSDECTSYWDPPVSTVFPPCLRVYQLASFRQVTKGLLLFEVDEFRPLPRRNWGHGVHYCSVLFSRRWFLNNKKKKNQCVKQRVKVPLRTQNKPSGAGKADRGAVVDSIDCTVVTKSIKSPQLVHGAYSSSVLFSPGNNDPLKHPQSTPSGSWERMEPFKMQLFSLCPCVPTVNAVCPLWQETFPQKGIASAGVIGTTSPLCAPWRCPTRR